jgi:hypothetical protein
MARHGRSTRLKSAYAAALAAAFVLPLLFMNTPLASATTGASSVSLHLTSQRPWLSPDGRLGLTLRLTNVGTGDLDGFLLRVGAYDRITSRSDLNVSFTGTPDVPASAFTKYFPSTKVRHGASIDVNVNDKVSALGSLGLATEGGVYPLTLYLYDADGAELLDSLTTSLIYYPEPPQVPLNLVLIDPINALPAQGPDGVFHPDETGRHPLSDALLPDGWLTGWLNALDASTHPRPPRHAPNQKHKRKRDRERPDKPSPLHLAVAPSPRLIAEIADLSDGFLQQTGGQIQHIGARAKTAREAASFLRRLRALMASPQVQTMLTPYSFPDLPALDRNFDLEHLARQLKAAQDVLQSRVGVRASWLFPPTGRLDASTLDALRLAGAATHTVISEGALQHPTDPAAGGCPSTFATFACPVRIRSEDNSSTGFLADTGLQQRVTAMERGGESRLDLQRFLAETAMIQAETPGVSGRVVQATLPPLWHPDPDVASAFFRYVAQAPWLHTLTPQEGLREGNPPVSKRLVASAPAERSEPAQTYFAQISDAETQVEHYATTLSGRSHPPQLLDRLRQDVLVAESKLWWGDPLTEAAGAAYATEAQSRATEELHKVSIGGVNEISMTSKRAEIPFVLSSRADHPVTININLFSPKLGFDRSQLTGIVVQHGTQQVAVEATARASGIFPVEVTVETADGYVMARKSIQVRSTNFNQIALGITVGALVFLIVFYVGAAIKKRKGRATGASPGPSTV